MPIVDRIFIFAFVAVVQLCMIELAHNTGAVFFAWFVSIVATIMWGVVKSSAKR